MTREEHIKIHKELHRKLDQLVADFIGHNQGLPSTATILDLMGWSQKQTTSPDEK